MAHYDILMPTDMEGEMPVVRRIGIDDLRDAVAKGIDDFQAMPTHVVFLCLAYPVIGLLLGRMALGYDVIPLLYPVAAGFALIGPIAAIGLYELSRRREAGLDTTWSHAFDVLRSPSRGPIAALGGLLLLIFLVWVATANALYVGYFGVREPTSLPTFLHAIATTPEGRALFVAGNIIGALFAVLAFVLSVVSFPLLLDRKVGFAVAIATSARAVWANPVTMALWGVFVAAALALASLPLFLGLAVVMPILGHATWHLYRKIIEPDDHPRPEYHPRPRGVRYAADFPSSLFSSSKRPPE